MIMKFYKRVVFVMVSLIFSACNGYSQTGDFVYKSIPGKYLEKRVSVDVLNLAANAKQLAFDITRMLPANYVTNGTVDYTAYMQTAINNHAIVLMPDFPVMINDSGLSLNTGQIVVFNDSSKIILKSSSLATYEIMRIHNVENVSVYFPVIYGDKTSHNGGKGQWGMGIAIRASKNVTIVNPRVFKCWGDGIYIGQIKNKTSTNINIYDPLLDDNRRNGISITSVNGLNISGGVIANSNGQMPQSGIDIEPNRATDVIDNINISNVVTFNHPKYGIVISLQQLVNRKQGKTSITITAPIDENSGNGLALTGKPNSQTLIGNIQIANPVWINNRLSALKLPLRNYGMHLRITRPIVSNLLKKGDESEVGKIKEAIKDQQNVQID